MQQADDWLGVPQVTHTCDPCSSGCHRGPERAVGWVDVDRSEGLIGAGLEPVELIKVNLPDRCDVTEGVVLSLQVVDGMVQLLPGRAHILGQPWWARS